MKPVVIIFAVLVVLLLLVLLPLVLWSTTSTAAPAVKLPTPNGWDTYVRIGLEIRLPEPKGSEYTAVEALNIVQAHQEQLQALEEARTQAFVVPYSEASGPTQNSVYGAIRNCFRLWLAQAKVAEEEERWNDAATIQFKIVKESRKLHNNGTLLTCLIASAYETAGSEGMVRIAANLTPEQAKLWSVSWTQLGRMSVADEVIEREKGMSGANGFWGRFRFAMATERIRAQVAEVNARYAAIHRKTEQALAEATRPAPDTN